MFSKQYSILHQRSIIWSKVSNYLNIKPEKVVLQVLWICVSSEKYVMIFKRVQSKHNELNKKMHASAYMKLTTKLVFLSLVLCECRFAQIYIRLRTSNIWWMYPHWDKISPEVEIFKGSKVPRYWKHQLGSSSCCVTPLYPFDDVRHFFFMIMNVSMNNTFLMFRDKLFHYLKHFGYCEFQGSPWLSLRKLWLTRQ